MSEEVKKVLANCAQNFSDAEKLQARTNIGAIGGVRVTDTSGTTDLVPDEQGRVTVDLTNAGKVQSDWEETNPNEASYIKNKPTIPPAPVQSNWAEDDDSSLAFIQNKPENLVQDADYVHTDNNFTDTDKDKLDGIEAGAEKNVQADWDQSNSSADDYIKNKPSIPAAQVQSDWDQSDSQAVDFIKNKPNLATVATSGSYNDLSDKPSIPAAQVQSDWNQTNSSAVDYIENKPANLVQDADYVHTDNNFTDNDKNKLDGIEAGAEQNVQADWNQTNSSADDYIKNKPAIPQPVQSDWTETNSADPSYIQNKPNLATVATSGSYNDLSDKPDIPSQQVQSDWTEADAADPAYIKNKPNLSTVATSGSYNDLSNKPTIPAAQVQSDWDQADSTQPDYIKNKPTPMETKPLVAGTNIEFVSGNDSVTINAKATKVVTRSAPYTTAVELSEMGVYDPGQDYGSVVKDQGGNTIGFLAPKHYGEADQGKVLTVVNNNGYKMEWRPAPQAGMDLKVLTQEQLNIEGGTGDYQLTVVDGKAYDLTLKADRAVQLVTNSESTVHTILAIHNNDTATCGGVYLRWRDEALEQHELYLMLYNEPAATTYYFDVYIKKVVVNGTPYAIARVSDYPCAYRNGYTNGYTNDNINFIGRNY